MKDGRKANEEELEFILSALQNTMIFNRQEGSVRDGVARAMFELKVPRGQKVNALHSTSLLQYPLTRYSLAH